MKAFLKENKVIVAGIALPLILTIIFFVTTQIERFTTADPQYSLLYTTNGAYSFNRTHRVIVRNNKAYLSYIPPRKDTHNSHNNQIELYLYSPKTQQSTFIDLPDTSDLDIKKEILIEDASSLRLSSNNVSPDGYFFGRNYRRSGNLMTEVFSAGNRGRSNHVLTKGNKTYTIPNTNSYNIKFVGWVISQ